MPNKENDKVNEELDAETEKELMKIAHSPIKGICILVVIIIGLLCFFVFNLRIVGALILIVVSIIGYYSSKKDLEKCNEIVKDKKKGY